MDYFNRVSEALGANPDYQWEISQYELMEWEDIKDYIHGDLNNLPYYANNQIDSNEALAMMMVNYEHDIIANGCRVSSIKYKALHLKRSRVYVYREIICKNQFFGDHYKKHGKYYAYYEVLFWTDDLDFDYTLLRATSIYHEYKELELEMGDDEGGIYLLDESDLNDDAAQIWNEIKDYIDIESLYELPDIKSDDMYNEAELADLIVNEEQVMKQEGYAVEKIEYLTVALKRSRVLFYRKIICKDAKLGDNYQKNQSHYIYYQPFCWTDDMFYELTIDEAHDFIQRQKQAEEQYKKYEKQREIYNKKRLEQEIEYQKQLEIAMQLQLEEEKRQFKEWMKQERHSFL